MSNQKKLDGYKVIFGYLGLFLIITGIINLVPLIMIIFFPNEWKEIWHYLIPGLGSIFVGIPLYKIIKGKSNFTTLKNQDAIIVTISWASCILISSIPYMFDYSFSQSVFESASALTTTGFSILNLATISKTLTMHRIILSFVGGIGIMLIMLVFLSDKRGMRLYNSEGHSDKLLPNLINSSKTILKMYIGYIIGGILLYMICGMNWLDAICHSVNAVATSGFSNKIGGLSYFNSISIEIITMILMLLGSLNFLVQFLFIKGKCQNLIKYCETKFETVLLCIIVPIITFLLIKESHIATSTAIRTSIFHVISALTTTGFSTLWFNFQSLSGSITLIFIILMIIGGGAGSTAGGIKLYRAHIITKDFYWTIKDKTISRNIISLHFVQKPEEIVVVDEKERNEIKTFVLLYLTILFFMSILLCINGNSLTDSIFEISSAIGGVGLSRGIFNSLANNSELWIGIITMFLGRLEIIVVLIAFVQIGKKIKDTLQSKKIRTSV